MNFPELTDLDITGVDSRDLGLILPALTTLSLGYCTITKTFCNSLPYVTNLHLKSVRIDKDSGMNFSELVSLKNLTLEWCHCTDSKVLHVSSLQLDTLTIMNYEHSINFLSFAPKLSALYHFGRFVEYVFPLTATGLERVTLYIEKGGFRKLELNVAAAKLIRLLHEIRYVKFLAISKTVFEEVVFNFM